MENQGMFHSPKKDFWSFAENWTKNIIFSKRPFLLYYINIIETRDALSSSCTNFRRSANAFSSAAAVKISGLKRV